MKQTTITIRPNDAHAITGSRDRVMAHYRAHGVALWLRANGRATLHYSDAGRMRTHTWSRFTIARFNADASYDWAAALIARTPNT